MYYRYESVWDILASTDLPIILYGTGNGADKIINEFKKRNIEISGIFASDSFVRERNFRGYRVESFESIIQRLGYNINVVLCFGTNRPNVIKHIIEIGKMVNLFIPEVPLYSNDIFDKTYLMEHENKILNARNLLDEVGKHLFDDAIAFKMTGDIDYLKNTVSPEDSFYKLSCNRDIQYVFDAGAYTGDTVKLFIQLPDVKIVYAVEPDFKNYNKLTELSNTYSNPNIIPMNFAVSDNNAIIKYSSANSRGSGIQGSNKRSKLIDIRVITIDSLELDRIDLMKFDIEGNELKALNGAEKTITRCKPALAISLYHRTDDLFEIPLYIKNHFPYITHFSLTRPYCIPFWDLTLIAY